METTRTYHRDSRLAFREHCDYACAVERPGSLIETLKPLGFWLGISAGGFASLLVIAGVL